MSGTSVYIASDMHFGVPDAEASRQRERHLIQWLEMAENDAQEIILLGDVFDFWFEYGQVVPKGSIRLLGKLAALVDGGVPVTIYTGNHDLWYGDYLPEEIGVTILKRPFEREWFGHRFFLAHGDGLGPGDQSYKLLRQVFVSPISRFLFRLLHPDIGIGLARRLSKTSRKSNDGANDVDHGEGEYLLQYARRKAKQRPEMDYFVFGHRHKEFWQPLENQSTLVVLGDWIKDFSYLRIREHDIALMRFGRSDEPGVSGIPQRVVGSAAPADSLAVRTS